MGESNPVQYLKDLGTAGTAGIFDFNKNRFNVPFSGAQVRTGGQSTINALTAEQARPFAEDFTQNEFAQQVTPYVGMAGAALTGSILGGQLGAMSSAGQGTGVAQGVGAESLPFLTDASGNVAMSVGINPVTGAAMPGAGMNASQLAQAAAAGTAGGAAFTPTMISPSGGMSSLVGGSVGSQLGSFAQGLGGSAPQLQFPQGGAVQSGPGGLTKQQIAALSAQQSEPHKGLAPRFEARSQGKQEMPGIASMGQYYGGQ